MITSHLRQFMFDKRIKTIAEMSRITGISRHTLKKLYENEGMTGVTLGTLYRICQAFPGAKANDLFNFDVQQGEEPIFSSKVPPATN